LTGLATITDALALKTP